MFAACAWFLACACRVSLTSVHASKRLLRHLCARWHSVLPAVQVGVVNICHVLGLAGIAVSSTGVLWRVWHRASNVARVWARCSHRVRASAHTDAHRLTPHGHMRAVACHLSFSSLVGCAVAAVSAALSEDSTAAARAVLAALLAALPCAFGDVRPGDGDLDDRACGVTSTILAGDAERERWAAVAPVLRCGEVCFGVAVLLALLFGVAPPLVDLVLPPIFRSAPVPSRRSTSLLRLGGAPPPMRRSVVPAFSSDLCITAACENPCRVRLFLCLVPCLFLSSLYCPSRFAWAFGRRSGSNSGPLSRRRSWSL